MPTINRTLKAWGLALCSRRGIVFNPLKNEWSLSDDTDVNFLVAAVR